ncbi:MAG: hypothetical protein KGL62_17155, partial [Bradyrhizobium sp.]|uniref:hypothetical protein n=1 Tax=Bradyrhizobium sp. TaxID=376 RepID=UPI002389D27D
QPTKFTNNALFSGNFWLYCAATRKVCPVLLAGLPFWAVCALSHFRFLSAIEKRVSRFSGEITLQPMA